MKEIKSTSRVHWVGDLHTGLGHVTTESEALDDAFYSVASRMEHAEGTNPEELIAATHPSCLTRKDSCPVSRLLPPELDPITLQIQFD